MTLLYYLSSSHRQRDHHMLAIVLSQLELNIQFLLSYNCRLQPTKLEDKIKRQKSKCHHYMRACLFVLLFLLHFSLGVFSLKKSDNS